LTNRSSFLLDTNAAIAYIRNDKALLELLKTADEVYTSAIVIGELYFGALNSGRVETNLREVVRFTNTIEILPVHLAVAEQFGNVRRRLHGKGRPIQTNDMWIAATALSFDLIVITRDADFGAVDGLATQSW